MPSDASSKLDQIPGGGQNPLPPKVPGREKDHTLYCSFCGKSQYDVKKLIAGPTVFICNECVDLCTEIIQKDAEKTEGKMIESNPPTIGGHCQHLHLRPH